MAYEILTANLPASEAVAIRTTRRMSELQGFLNEAFLELNQVIRNGGANSVGPPFVRYYSFTSEAVDLEAVMTCDKKVPVSGRVYVTTIAEVPDPSEWVTLVEQPIA